MLYSKTLSLNCPHCDTKCQFVVVEQGHQKCINDDKHHIPYICTNCNGLIATKWTVHNNCSPDEFRSSPGGYGQRLDIYYPIVGDWKPRVNLQLITNEKVRTDFKEAISCYNNGFNNACMLMARRSIQQEIIDKHGFAKLSLEFLDRYFANEYEIDSLVESAPRSQKELEEKEDK